MFVGVPLGIRYGSGDIQFVGGPDGIIGFGEKGVRGRRVGGEGCQGEKGVRGEGCQEPFFCRTFFFRKNAVECRHGQSAAS
jgi:hypothetical protein